MWIFVVIISVYVASPVECADCAVSASEECHTKTEPQHIPGDKEELDAFCDYGLPFYECAINRSSMCDESESVFRQYILKAHPLLQSVCEKGTFYEDLIESLSCFRTNELEILKHYGNGEIDLEEFYTNLSDLGMSDVAIDDNSASICVENLYELSSWCLNARKMCGKQTEDTLIEILQKLEFPFKGCRSEIIKDFPNVLRARKLEES